MNEAFRDRIDRFHFKVLPTFQEREAAVCTQTENGHYFYHDFHQVHRYKEWDETLTNQMKQIDPRVLFVYCSTIERQAIRDVYYYLHFQLEDFEYAMEVHTEENNVVLPVFEPKQHQAEEDLGLRCETVRAYKLYKKHVPFFKKIEEAFVRSLEEMPRYRLHKLFV